jgi:hypothetical protein
VPVTNYSHKRTFLLPLILIDDDVVGYDFTYWGNLAIAALDYLCTITIALGKSGYQWEWGCRSNNYHTRWIVTLFGE